MTAKAIYEADGVKKVYKHPDLLAAALSKTRDSGLIENGLSEIVDGKTRLTWTLTKPGREALQQNTRPMGAPEQTTDNTNTDHIVDANKMDTQPDTNHIPDTGKMPRPALDIEAVKRDVLDALDRWYTGRHEMHIDDAEIKIETLEKIAKLMSDEISDILHYIIVDIKNKAGMHP
jgi:hypothetical protein